MRLLNTTTLELTTFQASCPPYAILSHTWGEDEAPFSVFATKSTLLGLIARVRKRRYGKVVRACSLARSQGYQWIWIDTCCIDNTSSAELSEAINSMYCWYERAGVCYAYLVDVRPCSGSGPDAVLCSLARSRWFTRGWTLQELVAPPHLEFYDSGWNFMDTKAALASTLEEITSIPARLFSGAWQKVCASGMAGQSLQLLSVAQRLSWAASRQTTRPEDLAYCLMGLFGVHMPLLYGEGEEKAFVRLQAEIANNTNDQSLFAWGSWYDPDGCEKLLCYSLFAPRPSCFAGLQDIKATTRYSSVLDWTPPFEMLNDGYLRIKLPVCENVDGNVEGFMDNDHVAFLECDVRDDPEAVVGLFLKRLDDAGGTRRYVRIDRLLGRFPKQLALKSSLEDVLLGSLPRHIPRVDFHGRAR
jgi:hypothetical protein